MKNSRRSARLGAALIVVLLISLLLCILSTTFVNFQVMDKRLSQDEVNSTRALMMADSGVSYALTVIARNPGWQGQDRTNFVEWVYQDGAYKCGFRVDSYYNPYHLTGPDWYCYIVRSEGVIMDSGMNPPRRIASRCVRAHIMCESDYNTTHAAYTPPGSGKAARLIKCCDEYR